MSSVLEIIVNGQDNASGVLRNVGGALASFGSSAKQVGMDLLPLSAGAAVVAGSALKMAADYEQSMDVLQASSGASDDEMILLGKTAVALGADMTLPGTSAKDAADAMLELNKAGVNITDTIAAAKGVLQLSAAAQISNADAAKLTAGALNMFKLSGDKATMVADLLAAGANKSAADINQMGLALQMSGNVAAAAGLSLGDVTTAIALMANQGVLGSDAGTSLKTMLMRLQAPTAKSAELMSALGISIFDSNGQMLPMPGLIEQFTSKLGPLTQEQRNAALATMFGTDAVRAANILLLGGTQAWNDMSTAVNEGGTAAEMAAAQNAGLKGAIDGVKSVIETMLLTAAGPLLESLTGIVRWVGDLIGKFSEANPQLTTAGIAFAAVLAVASPLALGIGVVATTLGTLLAPIGLVVVAVAALAAAWTTNFGNIQGIVAEVVATVQGILAQLQAFITEHSTQIMGPLNTAWTGIQNLVTGAVNAVWSIVSAIFGQLQTFIASHGEQIQTFMLTAWQAIGAIVNTTIAILQATIIPALQAIAEFIRTHGTEIQAVFSAVWAAIEGIISVALTAIQGVLKAILQAIHGDWKGAWETLKTTGATIWETIKATIQTIAAALGPILAKIWDGIKAAAVAAWEDMKAAAIRGWENIKAAIAQKIAEVLAAILKWLDDTLSDIENFDLKAAAQKFFGTVLPGIIAAAAEALAKVTAWLKSVFDKIRNHDLEPATKTSFGTVVAGIAAKASDILKNVGEFLSDAADKIRKMSFRSDTMKAIQTVIVGILDMVGKILATVADFLADIRSAIASFSLVDAGRQLMQGMIDGIKSMAGALVAAARGVVQDAIDAAKSLLGIKSPSTVFAEIGRQVLEGLILGIDEKQAETAKAVAEAVAAICEAAVKAVDALRDFQPVDNLGVITAQVMAFLLGVETQFAALVAQVEQELADKAQEFAEAVAPVVDLIGSALEVLGSLPARVAKISWQEVVASLEHVAWALGVMVGQMATWAERIRDDAWPIAQAFAEAAGPVVDIIGGALETLGSLTKHVTRLSWQELTASLEFVAWALGVMVGQMATWAERIRTEAWPIAQGFAEAAAPVVDVIGGALEVLGNLTQHVTRLSWQELTASLEFVAWALGVMVGQMATWAEKIMREAWPVAREFAEAAGPVVDVITSGLEALTALSEFQRADAATLETILANMQTLNRFLASLVSDLAKVAGIVKADLQTAAREFADNVSPVIDVITGGLDALTALSEFEGLDAAAREKILANMQTLDRFLASLVADLAKVAGVVGRDLQTAARQFAENVTVVLDALTAAFDTLKSIGELEAPAVGLAWVANLKDSMEAAAPAVQAVLDRIVTAFYRAAADLPIGAYDAGRNFMTSLADGITSGMDYLVAALAAVAALFPHSPAKAGPLRVAPDWAAWMLGGLDDAAGLVSSGLAWQMPRGLLGGGLGQSGGTTSNSTTVNINSPTIRDEMDIRRLADAVSAVLTGQQSTNRRLGATW